jgi:acylphosphatase
MTQPSTLKRGALPSPRHALAGATPFVPAIGAPPNFIVKPAQISMWGNDVHGDCVTAEEAFAKACNNPEIFIPEADVIAWAQKHGWLEGAYLTDVLNAMQNDGFAEGNYVYDDGPYSSVNWTNAGILQSAIALGPVKLGIAADQLETAYWSNGGHTGWFGTGFHNDSNEDHCVALCGYGSISWLAGELGVAVPAGVNGAAPGYALFTWNSIGIIDVPSMVAITQEAWLRQPTTVTKNTGGWSNWLSEGGILTSNIALGHNADGRLEAFVRGTDNALWHKWQTSPNGTWSGWQSLGGVLTSDPVVGTNADGRMEVFVRGTDNALWHIWQTSPNGNWSSWFSSGGVLTSNIGLGRNADGRLEAFVRGTDNALWHIWQTTPNGTWSGWASLGGVLTSDPIVASNADGRLEVFVRGTDNALWHIWEKN